MSPRNAFTIVNEVGETLVNRNSSTYNNMANFISGARTGASPALPGYQGTNTQGYDVSTELRDPAAYDFRLKTDSTLRNAGSICTEMFSDIENESDPCYRAFGQGKIIFTFQNYCVLLFMDSFCDFKNSEQKILSLKMTISFRNEFFAVMHCGTRDHFI